MNQIHILVVDDHKLIADGIKNIMAAEPDLIVVASARNGNEALEIVKSNVIHVILMDINMPEMDGLETTRQIKALYPQIHIIALSMYNDLPHLQKMVQAGASGYLLKSADKEELMLAIRKVYANETYFSGELTLNAVQANYITDKVISKKGLLSNREEEVLKLVTKGLSSAAIAEQLYISQRTVETHRTNLMKKIGASNVAGMIAYAYQNGLLN